MEDRVDILLLEDVATDAELVGLELRRADIPCSLRRVETREDFINALEERRPALILADYSLPSFTGLDALKLAREKCPDVPFILVSGALGEDPAIESLKQGATDYVLKNRLSRLGQAVRRALAEAEERARRRSMESRLKATNALLELFARTASRKTYLDAAVDLLGRLSHCRAIGIRMVAQGGAIPYEATVGFSEEFLRSECWLFLNSDQCVCTRVVLGQPLKSDVVAMTPGGSFCCNNTAAFVQGLSEAERGQYRAECARVGFASVAVIPIRYRGSILGAVHLADERPDMIDPRTMDFVESMAPLIGEAVYRFNVEDALKESEERYRQIFEASSAATLLLDPETGAVVHANPAACEFYGYTPSAMTALRMGDIMDAPADELQMQLDKARNSKRFFAQSRHRLASGDTRDVEIHACPIVVRGRTLVYAIVHDVTERVKAERSLRETHELLERTFMTTHVMLVYLDANLNFVRVNEAYARACARRPEEFVGKNHFELYPHEENERIFRRVVETGEAYTVFAKPFVFPDHTDWGVTYWDWSLQPVFGPSKNVVGLVFSLIDRTEHERTRKALHESERLLRAVFEQTFQFLLIVRPDGVLVDANQSVLDFVKSRRDEVAGRPMSDTPFWPAAPDKRKRLKEALQSARRGQFVRYETEFDGAAGRRVTVDFSVKPVRDENKQVILLILEARDITDRRRLEQEILETSRQERQRVGQDLHDVLGQNLTGVAFQAKMLEKRLQGKGLQESADAARIAALVNQSIATTRAMARGLHPVEFRAEGLMAALEELAASASEMQGTSCQVKYNRPVLIRDHSVAIHLFHIAQEALNNAARHGKAKHVVIRLSRVGHRVTMTVRDDGSGFSESRKKGDGIGLRIMQHRAAAIGGVLDIRPLPAGGMIVVCSFAAEAADLEKE